MTTIGALLVGFAAGSIPFGLLLVRIVGRGDVRDRGSGNIGATNVARVLGPVGGGVTLLADGGKGALGVLAGGAIAGPVGAAAGGLGAVLGHCFSPWLAFRGGKGVATTLGAFALLAPMATLAAVVAFAAVASLTRIVSVASLVAVALLALVATLDGSSRAVVMAAWVGVLVVTVQHRANLTRLRQGREARVERSA